jgi:hypothetical protein
MAFKIPIPITIQMAADKPPCTQMKTAGFRNERIVSHCRHRGHSFAIGLMDSAQKGQMRLFSAFMV